MDLVVVMYPSGGEKFKTFLSNFPVPGTILIDDSRLKYSKQYGIKSYPTAFLLNSDHQVVLAPARTPLDGFEQQFVSILQAERINQLRQKQKQPQ